MISIKKTYRLFILIALVSIVTVPHLLASGKQDSGSKGPITIASKFDTEGALLGNIIRIVLENDGFNVNDKTELGPTDVVRKALETGEIDMYPEYTGNGNWFFTPNDYGQDWYNRDGALKAVRELDKNEFDIIWLEPAPANNTWAIAIRQDMADTNNLATMSDFAQYINNGGQVKLAGSEEFFSRPDSLPAFEKVYGFSLTSDQKLILSSGNTTMTEQAAARGTDGVNAAMAYGTDGQLSALQLVVLQDNLESQPVYEPAPRVRASILAQYPEIEDLLNPIFRSLDLETLQRLNSRISVEGLPANKVAEDWLRRQKFIR